LETKNPSCDGYLLSSLRLSSLVTISHSVIHWWRSTVHLFRGRSDHAVLRLPAFILSSLVASLSYCLPIRSRMPRHSFMVSSSFRGHPTSPNDKLYGISYPRREAVIQQHGSKEILGYRVYRLTPDTVKSQSSQGQSTLFYTHANQKSSDCNLFVNKTNLQ
jgi:hypothetical protein